MKHTKQMYVVVNINGTPLWHTIQQEKHDDRHIAHLLALGCTVQPVTVTIELQ